MKISVIKGRSKSRENNVFKKSNFNFIHYSLFILYTLFFQSQAEGTKELMAGNCSNHGYIQIWDNGDPLRRFATYNCPSEYRLNVRVVSGERIYMGFHVVGNNLGDVRTDVWMRLRAPDGTIALGPIRLRPTMGAGWINNCNQAMNGPSALYPGGYNAIQYTATQDGNYYIEFAINNDPTIRQRRVFRYFDVTVARWDGSNWVEKRGRLWSQNWDLQMMSGSNPFVGTLYTYSKDSIVTSFDFNGMRPYGFEIACNSFGASDVGTSNQMRMSDYRQIIINNGGHPAAPEYPIFLNDPDTEFYPTGIVGSVDSFGVIPCTDQSYCIYVSLTKAGQVEVVLTFQNGSQVTFIENLNAGPNCIEWDGKDGFGNPVQNGDTINIRLAYFTGLTHLPLIDVENHPNGFYVFLVRPTTKPDGTPLAPPKVYWDDSNITTGNALDGLVNLAGCQPVPGNGCHKWTNRGANNSNPEVINTWWYTNTEEKTIVFEVDSTKWRVFSEIDPNTCGNGADSVVVHIWFSQEIPYSNVSWSMNTSPPGVLGSPVESVDSITDSGWTHVWLKYPVTGVFNNVTLFFYVTATSTKYPYCESEDTLSCIVLSVGLETFKGKWEKDGNYLQWKSIYESNLFGYEIERAERENQFVSVGFVPTENFPSHYSFVDRTRESGKIYLYRLKILDYDGSVQYSKTIEVIPPIYAMENKPVVIYNSFNQTLQVEGLESEYYIAIYDALGRLIQSTSVSSFQIVPVGLSPGIYFIHAKGQRSSSIQKLLIP